MKKRRQVFAILTLCGLLMVLISFSGCSHLQVKSNQSHDKTAVVLDNQSLFKIYALVGSLTPEERAKKITQRISAIAQDTSIEVDSLKVEEGNGTTNIISDREVFITLTDIDAQKAGFKHKEKLANLYLEKLKRAIKQYRNQRRVCYISLFLLISFFILLLIFSLIKSLHKTGVKELFKSTEALWEFILDLFGRGIEFLIFLTIIILLARLVLIIANSSFEVFSIRNLTTDTLKELLENTFIVAKIIGLLFLFGTLSLFLRWLSRKGIGTVILPFEDTTGKYNSKAIADSLIEELHRIRSIHSLIKPEDEEDIKLQGDNFPPLTPIQENVEGNLMDIGTVGVGETKFSIGRIILTLKQIWPFGGVNQVISGSIQAYGSITRLVMRLEYHNQVSAWEVTHQTSQPELMPKMIRELAYKVSWKLVASNISAQTWEGLMFFTEAISSYYQYQQTSSSEKLQDAEKNCSLAMQAEKKYKNVADLFYKIGISYLRIGEYCKAEMAFKSSLEVEPNSEFSYNGLGNVYSNQKKFEDAIDFYNHAKRINPKFPYPYNGLGNLYLILGQYQKALDEYRSACRTASQAAPTFWKPYANCAIVRVYGDGSDLRNYDQAIKNLKKAIELSQGKFSEPHGGLGMTYLFKAVNIDDSAERENLLNMSVYKTQQAIDIDLNKIPYYYWNLGLARLVQQKIPETEKAWEKALNILSRGRTYLTGSDKLRSLIYQYAIQSLEPVSFSLSEINQSLQKLTEFLEEEKLVYQDHYKKVILKTYFKILLEDLKIITKISNDQNNKMNLIKANINHLIIKLNEMITILDHI